MAEVVALQPDTARGGYRFEPVLRGLGLKVCHSQHRGAQLIGGFHRLKLFNLGLKLKHGFPDAGRRLGQLGSLTCQGEGCLHIRQRLCQLFWSGASILEAQGSRNLGELSRYERPGDLHMRLEAAGRVIVLEEGQKVVQFCQFGPIRVHRQVEGRSVEANIATDRQG